MRLIFAGTPDVAVPSLDAIAGSGHDLCAVVTRPPAPTGRGRTLVPSPVEIRARELGLEVISSRPRDAEFSQRLEQLSPDCCPIVAYGEILRADILRIPRLGWINLHFSLLPQWRGAAPVQAAIRHGDDVTGATTFLLDAGMDTGPILGSVAEHVRPTDTAGDVLARLSVTGAELLVRTLDAWEAGSLSPHAQPHELATYCTKVDVEDARIDWSIPAIGIERLIRSCTPAPGAWTTFRDERIRILPVTIVGDADLHPGEIRVERSRVLVGTATTAVALTEVIPQGRRRMAAPDWARGVRIAPGERLA